MVGKKTPYDIMTGSNLPAWLGLSGFKGPNEVLQDAFNDIQGQAPNFIDPNEAMSWGDTLEPVIAQQASVRLGLGNPQTKHEIAVFHEEWPLAVSLDATIDGNDKELFTDWKKGLVVMTGDSVKLEGRGCLEIKVTGQEAENAPALYRGVYQLQAQMACTNSTWGCLAILYKGTKMRCFIYGLDPTMQDEIKQASYDFYNRVEKYRVEEVTEWVDMTSTKEATSVYDEAFDTVIELPEVEQLASDIVELKEDAKHIYDEIEHKQALIMQEMKEAKKATAGNYTITWPMLNYKAQPEKVVAAKAAYSIRQSKLRIKQHA